MTDRHARIVRAAERLIEHWKRMSEARGHPDWLHKGCWYPLGSEKQAKALINAVLAKGKKCGERVERRELPK